MAALPVYWRNAFPAQAVSYGGKSRESRIGGPLNDRDLRASRLPNLPFDEWTGVFASERLTGALLDRLTHHVHILEMNGDSYRLKQSKRRQRQT